MGRMGDTIQKSRLKYGLTEKQLAKKTGLAESVIKDFESGRRIPSDDQARRILKAMGVSDALGTEIDTANEPEVKLRPRPRPYIIPVEPDESAPSKQEMQAQAESNDAWLDALGGVVKRVPVMDENGLVIDHLLYPIVGGRIEGGQPDKVIAFRCPNDELGGFRVHAGDVLLVVPDKTPVDDAIMLISLNGKRRLRRVKKLEGSKLILQAYERELKIETKLWAEVQFLGRCVKLIRTL
ncbi:MAG: helix-turn-helix domain-containing protein [Clostridia bacterium]|nr:helix-turn-helix domain-containing protein [Clostridia bacterium]